VIDLYLYCPPSNILQRETEVWVLITQLSQALFGSRCHLRSLLLTLLVVILASEPCDCRSNSSHACQSETSAETSLEPRGFLEQEDVGADKGTCGTEVDDSCKSNSTLVSTSAVHGNPDDGDRHGEVATASDEEHAHVSDLGVGRVGNLNSQTCSERCETHEVEVVAAVQPLTCVGEDNREDGANKVDGDGVYLGLDGGVAETFEYSRLEVGKRICVLRDTEVHDNTESGQYRSYVWQRTFLPCPDLPVLKVVKSLLEGNVFLGDVVVVSLDTGKHKSLIIRVEELALLRELWDSWEGCHADEDGNATLDDEDPATLVSRRPQAP
jgi:hypothetical protein